jgi:LuxR family quorum sensing-dependent transcriptional regulator
VAEKFLAAFDFIDRVKEIDTVEELVAAFQGLIGQYGFGAYCVGNATAPKLAVEDRVWCATWPDGWASVWQQKNFAAVDPVVYQLLATSVPFRWSDVRQRADESGAEVMDVAACDFRMRDGLGIPVIRHGQTIGITIAGEQCDLSERDKGSLHMAAIYFQARLEKLRAAAPRPVKQKHGLTTRERDCIAWAAAGKTDWEIGQILSIAEQTVHSHVRNALRKLDAMNRTHAVAICMAHALIRP